MRPSNRKTFQSLFALVALLLSGTSVQAAEVDPAATRILQRMTDYLSGLQKFSVQTENTLESLLDSGQRIDRGVSANVTISRPNQLRAERRGDLVSQFFYYDGKTLTLYNPDANVYATEPAPATIEETLKFARQSLELIVPAADLVYHNPYSLLMEGVTSAIVVGKAIIGGVTCNHLAFSRPGVDFQVWVAAEGQPLPYKYVVTDRATPERLSVTTVMSNWAVEAAVADISFTFVPPEGVSRIPFMHIDANSGSIH